MKKLLFIILSFFLVSCSCSKDENLKQPKHRVIIIDDIEDTPKKLCSKKIDTILSKPSVQKYNNSKLLELFYQAKTHPVWLVQEPEYSEVDDKLINAHRSRFEKSNPWGFLISDTNKKFYEWKRNVGREVFLRNGYLYHPKPLTAHAITQLVSLDMLIRDEPVLIQRGPYLMAIKRNGSNFFYKDGPYKDRVATINFLDRIIIPEGGQNEIIPQPLHIDFTSIKEDRFFDRLTPKHVTDQYVVADVYYGEKYIETLFEREGDEVIFDCETKNTDEFRESRKVRAKGITKLKKAMMNQVLERIPFDEPKYEKDQEDGKLRDQWMLSFHRGRLKYQYRNERMVEENYIYGHLGDPRPPQVCVDFLVDTIDRAAGSWYTSVDKRRNPHKTQGSFDSLDLRYEDEDGEEQHYALRNVKGFTHFARDYPEWFDVIDIPQEDRVRIGSKEFFDYLPSLKLQEGDMVFIKGPVPWDYKEEHSHSFMIYQTDPVTGIPVLLAGNAGSASLRPWKIETNRTPKRSIKRIVRIKDEFLKVISNNR